MLSIHVKRLNKIFTSVNKAGHENYRNRTLFFKISYKGPFIFYEGGGAGGIREAPFKNCMTPLSLPIFFTWPPPLKR